MNIAWGICILGLLGLVNMGCAGTPEVKAGESSTSAAISGAPGSPLDRNPDYLVRFTLPPVLHVGTETAAGLVWEAQPTGGEIEGVVVASWCPACDDLLAARKQDPKVRAATANLFYLVDEAPMRVWSLLQNKVISKQEAARQMEALRASGQIASHPEKLAGLEARVLSAEEIPVEWLPFFFKCREGSCEGWAIKGS